VEIESKLDKSLIFSGLRQRQLCELMGWDYRTVAQTAKQQKMSTHAYIQQQTGWTLRSEFYYPPIDSEL
jgi:hypothetical protein